MRVLIIGAGISGLKAAKTLETNPEIEIQVLEASEYAGGRIKAAEIDGMSVDLGASWMHQTRHNKLFKQYASQLKMVFTDLESNYYTQNGLVQSRTLNRMLAELESIINEELHLECPEGPETNLPSFINQKLSEMLLVNEDEKAEALLFYRQIEHFIGQKFDEIPAAEGLISDSEGRDVFLLNNGYTKVLQDVLPTDPNVIKFGHLVTKVGKENNEFSVETVKGTFKADFVICTVPLGALKLNYKQLFAFDLPAPLIESIEQTSMAQLGKIVFKFGKPFWKKQTYFVIHTETKESVSIVCPYEEPIVMVLIAPPLTLEIEQNPNTAFDRVIWALKAISSGEDVPKPVSTLVSDWSTSKLFGGSYSARSIDQNYNDMVFPFIEGAGKLRFAGEHTVWDGNGCVHGACDSGEREAKYILNM